MTNLSLVLLPGLDGTGELFAPIVSAIDKHVSTDILSYPPDRPLNYDELTEFVLDRLPRDERFVILGESFGGPLAVKIATRNPAGLKGIILCASFVSSPLPWLRPIVSALPARSIGCALRAAGARVLMGRFRTPKLRELLVNSASKPSAEALRSRALSALSVDVTTELRDLEIPTLFIQGTEDYLIPSSCANIYSRYSRQPKVARIVGPHCLLQCAVETAAETMLEFLSDL